MEWRYAFYFMTTEAVIILIATAAARSKGWCRDGFRCIWFELEAETVTFYNDFLEMWVYQSFDSGNT
jgi:hypothetical protein